MPTLVVAGALCQGGKVLFTQRPEGKPFALSWGYPGGKVQPGEAPNEALRRKLEEELGKAEETRSNAEEVLMIPEEYMEGPEELRRAEERSAVREQ